MELPHDWPAALALMILISGFVFIAAHMHYQSKKFDRRSGKHAKQS